MHGSTFGRDRDDIVRKETIFRICELTCNLNEMFIKEDISFLDDYLVSSSFLRDPFKSCGGRIAKSLDRFLQVDLPASSSMGGSDKILGGP